MSCPSIADHWKAATNNFYRPPFLAWIKMNEGYYKAKVNRQEFNLRLVHIVQLLKILLCIFYFYVYGGCGQLNDHVRPCAKYL